MPLLTRLQKYSLVVLAFFMLVDLAISSWGVLFAPGFTEANALFARLVHRPLEFIAAIGAVKLAVMAGILVATVWFNQRERSDEDWHGGDIICSTAAMGMGAMLLVLVAGNIILIS
jgi:hypothetical protein